MTGWGSGRLREAREAREAFDDFELDLRTDAGEAISIFVINLKLEKTSLASLTDGHADIDCD